MAKKVDKAGHWLIKANPLSKEGVYMYSGKVIDPAGELGLEADTLYPVYRPASELSKSVESFNGVEVRNEHEMVGDGAGMTPADSVVCGGTVFNVRMNPDDAGEMICDMRLFGDELRNLIKTGKKQLSLGYFCKYKPSKGEFNGTAYDFIQYDLEGNHVALVKEGRMGSSVRVFDSMTFDSMEIPTMPTDKDKDNKQNGGVREEIAKMLEGKDEDILSKCKDALEGILNPDKCNDEDEGKEPTKDDPCPHCGKEIDLTKGKDEDEPKKDVPDCGDEDEPKKDEPAPAGDTAMDMKEVMREIAHRDRLADGVADIIGAFDHAEMTVKEVATYACDKLELPKDGDCVARIEGFIAARAHSKKISVQTTATDAAEDSSDFAKQYLKK